MSKTSIRECDAKEERFVPAKDAKRCSSTTIAEKLKVVFTEFWLFTYRFVNSLKFNSRFFNLAFIKLGTMPGQTG